MKGERAREWGGDRPSHICVLHFPLASRTLLLGNARDRLLAASGTVKANDGQGSLFRAAAHWGCHRLSCSF